ncbi:MAG: murein biosynthesis integral membrane protein MurJ [Gammaproteobacteria bacterium]|nr:murein biosynthesis integral membrane protein MurJ [Gammaproteobacteria bacterium]MCP5136335.1 murein biosynthesis integral membrane protein MurJ [Gammaproteobacteria bacterium]
MSLKLLRSSAVVGAMTMISRVLGFVRDVVVAWGFGASAGTDAFFVAFKIPNFLRRLFAEGAFSQAFVPVLSEYRTQREHEEVRGLIASVAGTLSGILFLITAIGVVAAPILIYVFAPGFSGDEGKLELASAMLRWTFPYLLFISLTAFVGGILNSYGRFAIPALTPVMLNVVLIAAALWLAPLVDPPIMALAIGVFAAGAIQLGFQLPFLVRLKLLPRPRWNRTHEGVRRIMKLMVPALFGSSVAQINLLLDTIIASFLVTGSVSWLYYSDRLMEFPLGVFAIAIATVILPKLSRDHASQDADQFSRTLDWGMRGVILVGAPAAVALLTLAGPMLSTLFQHGDFDAHAVSMARLSLMAYGVGLVGFMLIKVLAPGFYSRQDTKTPVRIGMIAMGTNMVFNLILVWPLAHAGLALATTFSAFLNAGLLYRGLRRSGHFTLQPGWTGFLLRVTVAISLMGALLVWLAGDLQTWFDAHGWDRALRLIGIIVAGATTYGMALLAMGMRPAGLRG